MLLEECSKFGRGVPFAEKLCTKKAASSLHAPSPRSVSHIDLNCAPGKCSFSSESIGANEYDGVDDSETRRKGMDSALLTLEMRLFKFR